MSLDLDDTFAFVAAAIADRRRVLEVGAGNGELAARLQAAGHEVTAIDPHVHHPVYPVAPVGILDYAGGPFDAVVFTRSLHHIGPLAEAVARARELLVPGGVLVLDELDVAAPDAATAGWYYDLQAILVAAGVYPAEHLHGRDDLAPVARWQAEHAATPPLHPAAAMVAAVRAVFADVEVVRLPYLYRYLAHVLPSRPVAEAVRAAEAHGIAAGALVAVGLRVTAR